MSNIPPELKCVELEELITRKIFAELTAEEVIVVDKHLAECDSCRELYESLKATTEIISDAYADHTELHLDQERVDRLLPGRKFNLILPRIINIAALFTVLLIAFFLLKGSIISPNVAMEDSVDKETLKSRSAEAEELQMNSEKLLLNRSVRNEAAEEVDSDADEFMPAEEVDREKKRTLAPQLMAAAGKDSSGMDVGAVKKSIPVPPPPPAGVQVQEVRKKAMVAKAMPVAKPAPVVEPKPEPVVETDLVVEAAASEKLAEPVKKAEKAESFKITGFTAARSRTAKAPQSMTMGAELEVAADDTIATTTNEAVDKSALLKEGNVAQLSKQKMAVKEFQFDANLVDADAAVTHDTLSLDANVATTMDDKVVAYEPPPVAASASSMNMGMSMPKFKEIAKTEISSVFILNSSANFKGYYYLGSDADYHYFTSEWKLKADKNFKIRKSDVSIAKTSKVFTTRTRIYVFNPGADAKIFFQANGVTVYLK